MQILLAAIFLFAGPACAAPTASQSLEQEPSELTVFGKMWIVENGARRVPCEGSFHLCYFRGSSESVIVRLDNGAFRYELPEHAYGTELGRLVLEGRDAVCVLPEGRLDTGKALDLEARFVPASIVRVRDRHSGLELDRGVLETEAPWPSERSGSFPYVVPLWPYDCEPFGWHRMRTVRVHVPGYAWGKANVDLLAGGTFWIEVGLEARLTVNVILPEGTPWPDLDLWGPSRWNESLRNGENRFDGLEAGPYRVVSQRPFARLATIELEAGESRSLTVDLTPGPPKPRAATRGTLAVDPTWSGLASPTLEFMPLAENAWQYLRGPTIAAEPDGQGSFAFDAGELEVGPYFVVVESLGWATRVEVAAGMEPLALRVPPKVRGRVRLVDAGTRQPVDVDWIAWRAGAQPPNGTLEWRKVMRSPDHGGFDLEAPRGPITICTCSASGLGLSSRDQIVELAGDRAELTLALEPASRIRVQLRDGERAVLFPDDVYPEARRPDGSEAQEGTSSTEEWRVLIVSPAGPCTVSLPAFGPWREPAALKVEARAREVVDVVFQLERKP